MVSMSPRAPLGRTSFWLSFLIFALFYICAASKRKNLHKQSHQKSSTVKHSKTKHRGDFPGSYTFQDENIVKDLTGTSFQAKWLKNLSSTLLEDLPQTIHGNSLIYNPKKMVDTIIAVLEKESTSQNKILPRSLKDSLTYLRDDENFTALLTDFDDAMNGRKNMMSIGTDLPELTNEIEPNLKDVGLRGEVFTGEEKPDENDLIRYSNYISGAGSTTGGFFADLPQNIVDLYQGRHSVLNYKHDVLEFRLKQQETLQKIRDLDMEIVVDNNIDTEADLRLKRSGVADIQDTVIDDSFEKIKEISGASNQKKLTQQSFNTQKKLFQTKVRSSSRKIVNKVFKKVGHGVETASTAFTFAQGGTDVAAGSEMLERADSLRNEGKITEAEYDTMMRNGRLRIAQGSFGLANGVKNVAKFTGNKIKDYIIRNGNLHVLDLAMEAKRFGMVVGSAISMGTTATSILKNAFAASDAAAKGHTGKAAMYGVMAGVDAVTFILDGVSLVTDFVFPPLSPIIDLVSTVLQVINTVLGFIADMVDLRSTKERVHDEFQDYLKSEAFNAYVDNMADAYRKRGFDVFCYYVDAEIAGVSDADKETLQNEKEVVKRSLTERAEQDFNDPQLRVALLDVTNSGKTLKGRLNDDEIIAGFGPDKIFGEAGDDILYGRGGDDTIYGGPGNDYLNGGTGRDVLLGGPGADSVVCEPAIDPQCKGGPGIDTLELSGNVVIYDPNDKEYITMGDEWSEPSCNYLSVCTPPFTSPVKGIYFDMGSSHGNSQARSGLSIGSVFRGYPKGFHEHIHKPAFAAPNTDLQSAFIALFRRQQIVTLFDSNELNDRILWFMAEKDGKKYFCNSVSFYEVSQSSVRAARGAIDKIPKGYVQYKESIHRFDYTDKQKKVEAFLTVAFKEYVDFDKFEKVGATRPEDPNLLSNFIPTTIIGDNEDNTIDVPYSLGDVVYTGEGNNVVSIGSNVGTYRVTASSTMYGRTSGFKKWAKYVEGGSGDNTVILQYMEPVGGCGPENYGRWDFANVDDTSYNIAQGKDYPVHVVYLKNISTIEVHSSGISSCAGDKFEVNASKYHDATRFIVNEPFSFVGPAESEKGVTILPRNLFHTKYLRFGVNTSNTISFQFYQDELRKINIDLSRDTMSVSAQDIEFKNAKNIICSTRCNKIDGNDLDNMIIATGGQITIDAKDGDDTIVSGRGRHLLNGGPGSDTFVIHGPTVEDVLTISVLKARKGNTISCTTTIYGKWLPLEKRFEIEVLRDDHNDVLLTSVDIVHEEGDEHKSLGNIRPNETKRKIYYYPGENFNDLGPNQAKVVQVKFTTTGSFPKITDPDQGNILRFESIKSFDDLKVNLESDELVFREKSSNKIVFVDQEWKNKFTHPTKKITNILGLTLDFVQRFPLTIFRQSDNEFNRATPKEILESIYQKLQPIESQLQKNYDSFIDSTLISSSTNEIDVGNGQNVVLAKTKGKTYKLGTMSYNSLIIANEFTTGSGRVTVTGGVGGGKKIVNAVVVGVGSGAVVDLYNFQRHHVIITNAMPDDVYFSKVSGSLHAKDRRGNVVFTWNSNTAYQCERLIFKKLNEAYIIFSCEGYVREKTSLTKYVPVTKAYYGPDKHCKLVLPFEKALTYIHFSNLREASAKDIYFANSNFASVLGEQYLIVPTNDLYSTKIDGRVLVNAIKSQFKGGLQYTDKFVHNDKICEWVLWLIDNKRVHRYEVTNRNDVKC